MVLLQRLYVGVTPQLVWTQRVHRFMHQPLHLLHLLHVILQLGNCRTQLVHLNLWHLHMLHLQLRHLFLWDLRQLDRCHLKHLNRWHLR